MNIQIQTYASNMNMQIKLYANDKNIVCKNKAINTHVVYVHQCPRPKCRIKKVMK